MPSPRHRAARVALDELTGAGTDTVIRDGASLLVRRGDVVVRARPAAERHVAERELALALRLVADAVPVTPPVLDRVLAVDGQVLTSWRWCEPVRSARSADLGLLAGHLRRCAAGGPGGLAAFDPLGHIAEVVADAGDGPDARWVRRRVEELRAPYAAAAADDPLGATVVHGDLHRGNVVVAAEGPLLTDLELGGWGPASYDAAAPVVAVRRYGAPTDGLGRFLDGLGVDPTGAPGFATFVDTYELWVTAWAVGVAPRDPAWAAEATRRVAALRDGADHRWQLS